MKTCVSHLINNSKRQKGTCIAVVVATLPVVAAVTAIAMWCVQLGQN